MITCKFPHGEDVKLRHAVADVIVLNNEGDEVLLVKRAEGIVEAGKWCLPGGYLDRDETVREGAIREVKEETGHNISDLTPFKISSQPNVQGGSQQNIVFTFITKTSKQEVNSDWEAEEVKWFKLSQLPKKDQFAFDHFDNIGLYKEYTEKEFSIPIID